MNNLTLILAGNGSYSNRGCEAILRGTTALLRNQLGECHFISNYFPSEGCRDAEFEADPEVLHHPFPLLKRYSLPWFEERVARKIFHQPNNIIQVSRVFRRSLQDGKAVLMLGGDNYSFDYGDSDIYFSLSRLAVEAGVPVTIWGASIGPFSSNPSYEQWAAKELCKIDLICARETATQEYLSSIGVTKNVVLTADPAFFLQPSACTLPSKITKILSDRCIGLNLSPLLYKYVKPAGSETKLSAWIKVAADIVNCLLNKVSLPILLIPHVTSEVGYLERDDFLFLSKVAQLLNEPERVIVLDPNLNASQTKWVIGQVSAFAGARTHSTLAAISSCVPTICIGYSMKARGIAQDIYGHLDWLIPGQDLVKAPSVLCDRMVSLLDQETSVRSQLERKNTEMNGLAKEAAIAFAGTLSRK